MNYRRTHLMIDFINIILVFMIAYTIICVLLFTLGTSSVINTLCLLPAPFISFFIRKYTRHIWSFLASHLLLTAFYILTTGNIIIRIVYGLYLIILTISSFYKKQSSDTQTNTSAFFLSVFFLLYLYSNYMNFTNMMQLNIVMVIAYVLLHIFNMYLLNLIIFFKSHERIVNIPFYQIKNSNNTLILFLGSLSFVTMIVFSQLPLGKLLSFVGKLIILALRAFFSLFHSSKSEVVQELVMEENTPMENIPLPESSHIMTIIATILQWVATISAVIAVTAIVLYILYKIYQNFYRKSDSNRIDKTEFILPFEKQIRIKNDDTKKRFHNFFARSNNDVIRKYFYKSITSSLNDKNELPKDLTPSQLSEYAILASNQLDLVNDNEKRKQLTAYYEKARYSNEKCSKEEVRIVKNIVK